MSLKTKIKDDIKQAMRDKNVVVRDTLRMLRSEWAKKELDSGKELSADEEIAVILSAVKSRKDSVALYIEGGRQELADAEEAEIAVLQTYLPQQLSEDEAKTILVAIAKEHNITEKKQMGQLMKLVLDKYRGQIDGKMASKITGSILQ